MTTKVKSKFNVVDNSSQNQQTLAMAKNKAEATKVSGKELVKRVKKDAASLNKRIFYLAKQLRDVPIESANMNPRIRRLFRRIYDDIYQIQRILQTVTLEDSEMKIISNEHYGLCTLFGPLSQAITFGHK